MATTDRDSRLTEDHQHRLISVTAVQMGKTYQQTADAVIDLMHKHDCSLADAINRYQTA